MLVGLVDDDLNFIEFFKEVLYPKLIKLSNDEENRLITSTTMLSRKDLSELDVCFFDILLAEQNSIDLIAKSRADLDTKIVYISANSNLVFDSHKTKSLTFIRKSNAIEDFDIFLKTYKDDIIKRKSIKISYQGKAEKILIDKIMYLNACGHDITIKTYDKEYVTISTLKKLIQQINDKRFVQVQKSTFININYIKELKKNSVIIKFGQEISVSRLYRANLNDKYLDHLLNDNI